MRKAQATYAALRNRQQKGLALPDTIPLATGGDTPVFDRARTDTQPRGPAPFHPFARAASDRRPGTPLPPEMTGDPHPDRLARAEAIRKQIAEHDNRYRIEGSTDEQRAVGLRPEVRGRGKGSSTFSSTPDIPEPRSYYIDVLPEDAAVEARRGDQVLIFATLTDAARCMTGERSPKWVKAIQNAAGGVTKSAFGWEWTRLRSRQKAKWKS
jgi:hypothetical protein